MIDSFSGKYHFLSNFYMADVEYGGLVYSNNEAAFQAAKTLNLSERKRFVSLAPNIAKRMGRGVDLRKDWEEVKYNVMLDVVRNKFLQNSDLADKLVATGSEELVEGNTWGDRTWGKVNGVGKNWLGEILMKVREELS